MELAFAGCSSCARRSLIGSIGSPDRRRRARNRVRPARRATLRIASCVGLAVLSLLSDAAEERPLVCVVDDAQWLDAASAQALAFVARRLVAESVGLVLAVRETPGERPFDGLPELVVGGLDDDDARALLEAVVAGPLDARVRDRIVAETHGNPLALLELPRGLTPAELAGGFGLNGDPAAGRPDRGALPAAAGRAAAGDAAAAPGRRGRAGRRCAPPVEGGRHARRRRRRRGPGRRGAAWSRSGRRCAFAIRWSAPRSMRAATPEDRRRVHQALADATDRGARARPPRLAPGRRRPPGSTRTSPPSWSARPRARGRGAAWRRRRPSSSAPPS